MPDEKVIATHNETNQPVKDSASFTNPRIKLIMMDIKIIPKTIKSAATI